jgi:hypothetical protein
MAKDVLFITIVTKAISTPLVHLDWWQPHEFSPVWQCHRSLGRSHKSWSRWHGASTWVPLLGTRVVSCFLLYYDPRMRTWSVSSSSAVRYMSLTLWIDLWRPATNNSTWCASVSPSHLHTSTKNFSL